MSGWIRVDRKIFKDDFFASEPMSEREAWLWMISKAAWKDTFHGDLEVPRGSFYCTLRELQREWKWASDKRVRTFLKRTQKRRMIGLNTDAKKTLVTICKYEDFQSSERNTDANGTQTGRNMDALKEQVNNKQRTSNTEKPDLVFSELSQWASPEACLSFIAYRKKHKSKALTERAAKMLANNLQEIFNAGHDPTDALGLAELRGWAAVSLEWYENAKGRNNGKSNENKKQADMANDPALEQIARLAAVGAA